MEITSTEFREGEPIPSKYSCDGQDISPPLAWKDIPEGTKSLALIADDPDAPGKTWVHWVVYDIPPTVNGFSESVAASEKLEGGGTQGVNDFKRIGYGGPCPPSGEHRYYFKLYALDRVLNESPGLSKQKLEQLMEGKILDQCSLMGTYAR
ncbi:MAG: YbhB/YbcL family Raf kinase inhibitor-like protein [Spirochaetia bacterium]